MQFEKSLNEAMTEKGSGKGTGILQSDIDSWSESWSALLKCLPWYIWVLAASPNLKVLTTVHISGVQIDWLFYGVCIAVTIANPQFFTQSISLRFMLLALLSLLPALLLNQGDFTRISLHFVSAWILYSAVAGMLLRTDLKQVFRAYLVFSTLAASWGILELALGASSSYGLCGWSYEPSHFVVAIAPAAFYVVFNARTHVLWKILFPGSLLLTMSTTGLVVGTALVLFLIRKNVRLALVVGLGGLALWTNSEDFRSRVGVRIGDSALVEELVGHEFGNNKTTASLQSNWHVAKMSFAEHFPLGVGFSNHSNAYDRFLANSTFADSSFYGTNRKSGHNLLIRWISEFGLLGVFLLAWFLRSLVKAKKLLDHEQQLILYSCCMHLFAKSIKLGSYFDYGTPFFVCLIFLLLNKSKQNAETVMRT